MKRKKKFLWYSVVITLYSMKVVVFWVHRVVRYKLIDVSEAAAASVTKATMKAAQTSETSVNFRQTARRSNPEDSHLHIHRRENPKSEVLLQTMHAVLQVKLFPHYQPRIKIKSRR
jgi:hypothetical protein